MQDAPPPRGTRICFVAHSAAKGGADLVLLETLDVLLAEGIECRVILPERGPLCAELDHIGVPFSVISYAHWMGRGKPSLFRRVRAALNIATRTLFVILRVIRWKCDVVYTNTSTVCVGALAARLLDRPHIWHLHEFGLEDQGLSFLFGERFSLAVIDRLSSRCICVSKALAAKYERSIEPSKITVIYPSMQRALRRVDQSPCRQPALAPKTERFRCVIVGTLIEGKGQEESVLAFAHLPKTGIDAELIIVGDGIPAYRRHLEDVVRSAGLEAKVVFVGRVENALPVMQDADAVLVCSKSEAFGRVTIEAMFAGKPVIGARSGATAELIEDGVNGLLYNPGDSEDLAAEIRCLDENPGIVSHLGENANVWARANFTAERYAKDLVAVLTHVLGRSSGGLYDLSKGANIGRTN